MSALEKLGYKPEVHETPTQLFGFSGDRRRQVANIILPKRQVGAASNDIGFLRQSDGTYLVHVSAFDKNRWDLKFPELVKHYAQGVVEKIIQHGPYQWDSQTVDEKGVTTIRLRVHDQ